MKKILVLFTGGTIGSITTDGIIDVEREGKYAVVEAYKSAYGDDEVEKIGVFYSRVHSVVLIFQIFFSFGKI